MHRTTLTILTEEPVTPALIARRIVEACGTYGALRVGEGIVDPADARLAILVSNKSQVDGLREAGLASFLGSPIEAEPSSDSPV